MPMTPDELRALARRTVMLDEGVRVEAQRQAARPDVAADAAALAGHDDRNVRVAALRVLAHAEPTIAVPAILRGLDDDQKRVREVAAKSAVRFLGDHRVVKRLESAVDNDESGSARPAAGLLAGVYSSPYGLESFEPVAEAVRRMRDSAQHRQFALASLLRARTLTPDVAELLRDFVATGTKEEAIAATRRLCGFRVAHGGALDDATRRTADRAWGKVYYWVRVPEER